MKITARKVSNSTVAIEETHGQGMLLISFYDIPHLVKRLTEVFNSHRDEYNAERLFQQIQHPGLTTLVGESISPKANALVLAKIKKALDSVTCENPKDSI